MVDEIHIKIHVDDSDLKDADKEAEEVLEKAEKVSEEVEDKARVSFNKVMLMARGAYMTMAGVIRATGGTVSTVFRMGISAAISTAAVLTPLLQAELQTPGMQYQAAIGLANLGLAMAAISMALNKQDELSRQVMALNTTLHGVSMMLGSYYI